ncbi:zinc metalloprotease [Microbulbifer agarilyticus]|uniref:hypothetical protein n=1 Tax=Microbulbifer agarilyticus TaxID=260552 RepID=UPI001CD2FFCB|nr:hypothetical protein [Microbulbifer agarilyticus]MCA0894635.1 hypothetical protein [Microbulbifer agarilyticus]
MSLYRLTFSSLLAVAAGLAHAETPAAELPTSLPVITDDCGGAGCADRRGWTAAQVQTILDGASSNANTQANVNSSSTSESNHSQGLSMSTDGTQVVYLDFNNSSPVFSAVVFGGQLLQFPSYEYSQAERDEIQRRIEADYAGFDIEFTQTPPASGVYSTLNFECEQDVCIDFGNGILFGRAQSIDIGNQIRDDSAFVDANLWQVLAQLDPSGSFLSDISGVPLENGDVAATLSTAVVNQASNTGAHELGHNLGLRHHDSFGSPGNGIPTTGAPSPLAFFPVFDGPIAGDEAVLHTMASGASVGLGLSGSTSSDRFFSERSVIKLVAGERSRLVSETSVTGENKKVHLRRVVAPNTILEGDNADGRLDIREALIRGEISQSGEVDAYRFNAKAGDVVSAEFNGFDVPVGDPVIGAITLFLENTDGSSSLVAQNFQNFEGFDALLIDAELPENGTYRMEVSAPNLLSFGYDENGQPTLFPLDETGNGQFRTGDYNLSIYKVEGKPGQGVSSVPGA